jgi:hypothetical protein
MGDKASIPSRAWQDTWRWLLNTRLGWILGIVGAGIVTSIFAANALWSRVLAGFIGSVAAVLSIVSITYFVHLWITPIRQRNEAYAEIVRLQQVIKGQSGETDPDENDPNALKLIDSFPKDNEPITTDEVKKIFLKFNKAIDRDNMNEALISNYYIRRPTICQWNICGWIQYTEGDTKLSWHVHEHELRDKERYGATDLDYPTFEIRIPQTGSMRRLRATDGSKLPRTVIRVKIKPDIEAIRPF